MNKWASVGLTVFVVAVLILAGTFMSINSTSTTKGSTYQYPMSTLIDKPIEPYINITITDSISGHNTTSFWMVLNGTVSWIGTPENDTTSLSNIHLVMYTHLDSVTQDGYMTTTVTGIHVEAYTNEPTIPTDAIDHSEVIIPTLGLDNGVYHFSLNCTTIVLTQ